METARKAGPGRKPLAPDQRKKMLSVRLAPNVLEYLDSCDNKALAIEAALRGSKGFREWNKSRANEPNK